jgi:hypothetical protein
LAWFGALWQVLARGQREGKSSGCRGASLLLRITGGGARLGPFLRAMRGEMWGFRVETRENFLIFPPRGGARAGREMEFMWMRWRLW